MAKTILKITILKDCKIGFSDYKRGTKLELPETMNLYYMESDGLISIDRGNQETLF